MVCPIKTYCIPQRSNIVCLKPMIYCTNVCVHTGICQRYLFPQSFAHVRCNNTFKHVYTNIKNIFLVLPELGDRNDKGRTCNFEVNTISQSTVSLFLKILESTRFHNLFLSSSYGPFRAAMAFDSGSSGLPCQVKYVRHLVNENNKWYEDLVASMVLFPLQIFESPYIQNSGMLSDFYGNTA